MRLLPSSHVSILPRRLNGARRYWTVLLPIITATVLGACGANQTGDPDATYGAAPTTASTSAEARFVLRMINAKPVGTASAAPWCPVILEGSLLFTNWAERSAGPVVARHAVQSRTVRGQDSTSIQQSTFQYERTDGSVVVRYTAERSSTFIVENEGKRLRTSDAHCYPGQSGAVVDITTELVYERAP